MCRLNTCWWRRLGGRHFRWFEVRYWGTSKFFENFLNVINAMGFRQTLCIFLMAKEKFKNIQKAFMVFDFILIQSYSRHPQDAPIFSFWRFFSRRVKAHAFASGQIRKFNCTEIRISRDWRELDCSSNYKFSKRFLGGDLPGKYWVPRYKMQRNWIAIKNDPEQNPKQQKTASAVSIPAGGQAM